MTPKEKATNLLDKYLCNHFEAGGIGMSWRQAARAATIAVEEIINSDPNDPQFTTGAEWEKDFLTLDRVSIDATKYWQEVKQELLKM